MKVISHDLNADFGLPKSCNDIIILPFSDWHDDDPNCNQAFVEAEVKAALSARNTFVIVHGDIVNFAFKNSCSNSYQNRKTPQESLEWAIETLRPLKEKILVLEDGNHEDRLWKECGIHAGRFIANELGIKERYAQDGALVFVTFGEQSGKRHNRPMTYSIYTIHGAGGGRKAGGKVNRLTELMLTVDADIYIQGHTHLPFQTAYGFYRANLNNRSARFVNKLFVNSSAALNYGGYGEKLGFQPSALAHVEIHLDGSKRKMKATLEV